MSQRYFRRIWASGFTLVELIVVITILVILGTIGFIQIQGFSSSARDSARIENLSNLYKGLSLSQIQTGIYPMPENPVNITASGVITGYQWFAKDQVGGVAKLSPGATRDPLDATMYATYSVNANQTKIQVMAFLEDGRNVTAFVPEAFASTGSDYSKRYPTVRWDTLGILLTSGTLQPVQESGTGVDLVKTTTLSGYTAVFSKDNTTASIATSGTGAYTGALFTFAYHQRDDLLRDKTVANLDANLLGYWDMETLTGWLLKDWSGYGGNAFATGATFVNGKLWKTIQFSTGYTVSVPSFNLHAPQKEISVSFWANLNSINPCNMITLNPFEWVGNDRINVHFPWYVTSPSNTYPWNIYWQFATSWSGISAWAVFPTPVDTLIGHWNHFVMVTSMAGWYSKIYQNGNLIASGGASWIHNRFAADLIMGSIDGMLDEVRIYNRALSDSETRTLYSATK